MKHPDAHSHHLEHTEVFKLLEVDPQQGLSDAQVASRREKHGLNQLTARGRRSEWVRFLMQFHAPLVYILLVATLVTAAMGEWVDAAVIFGVVLVNAIIGFFQESKAEKSIEALSRSVKTMAMVRRGGQKVEVASEELVPGDVVLLQSGDRVPADLRLTQVKDLQVDESMLTGESVPVAKQSKVVAQETILADRKNQGFAGSLVTYGQAEGVVWAIGDRTEMGRVATLIHEAVNLSTPLTRKIEEFSKVILVGILALAALAFAIGILRGNTAGEMFIAAVAIAVGAIPEGLPAAVTITLAVGVTRMARRRAIIRKLPAVETLGSTTVICSDKTGTLTENQMTVRQVFAGGLRYEITGTGFEPKGQIEREGAAADVHANVALADTLRAGLLCNDSQLRREGTRHMAQGDPTEVALIVAAAKAELSGETEKEQRPRLDVIPFESQHQFMATLHGVEAQKHRVIYKKGAVERILERCTTMLDASGNEQPLDADAIRKESDAMASGGLRVLGLARRHVEESHGELHHDHVKTGMTFLGLQGMIDPPREQARDAVAKCQQAGMLVKMITGDHVLTAKSIAQQLGLRGGDGAEEVVAVTGHDLKQCDDEQLADIAQRAAVFARVSPEEKFRLVKALQSRGHVVAMTGDGVNDAPALKQADIGIAMGITGTEVAKSAADMILTDDNFATIEAAVEEGRGVFDNLTKFILWTLPTNIAEASILIAAIFVGIALPALPVHLLWINMMTAIFLGTVLVLEPKEGDLMQRQPRDPKTPILTYPLFMRTGLVSLTILIGAFWLFYWELEVRGLPLNEARTIVVNVIVVTEMFYMLNCRSLTHSMWAIGVFSNKWVFVGIGCMVVAQLAFTYLPVMNKLFHTAPISGEAWLHILAVGVIAYSVVGFEKWVRFNRLKEKV